MTRAPISPRAAGARRARQSCAPLPSRSPTQRPRRRPRAPTPRSAPPCAPPRPQPGGPAPPAAAARPGAAAAAAAPSGGSESTVTDSAVGVCEADLLRQLHRSDAPAYEAVLVWQGTPAVVFAFTSTRTEV